MQKKKQTKRSINFPNEVLRASIFQITKSERTFERTRRIQNYGESKIIIHGRLYEEDRGVLLYLMEKSKQNKHEPFDFSITEMAKSQGVKNPYCQTVIQPRMASINRLFDSNIRIKPNKEKGCSARFVFIQGFINEQGKGIISVSPFIEIIRAMVLGQTWIDLNYYYELKSPIARSIYCYLSTQQPFYSGKGYEIRLSLLLQHINYDTQGKPYWEIMPHVKRAIQALKKTGFIHRFRHNQKKYRSDGGLFTFYPAQKSINDKQPTLGDENSEFMEIIKETFPNILPSMENSYRTELNKLRNHLENEHEDLHFHKFIRDYLEWLENNSALKYPSPKLFNINNIFLNQFLQIQIGNDYKKEYDPYAWEREKREKFE